MTAWWNDFEFSRKEIYVRTTDVRVPITWAYTKDTLTWFAYYLAERARGLPRLFSKPSIRIACLPAPPRAWYLLWAAAFRAGADLNAPRDEADVLLYFEDQTVSTHDPDQASALPSVNERCVDISKTRVQEVFKRVFGYSLSVDPISHNGEMVEKSDINGAHDGRILQGPVEPREGYVYQRVIDNRDGDMVLDLRCPTAGGQIDLIYLKRRPASQRFENLNTSCILATPQDYLSAQERETLTAFCAAMQLDWGGLDVLRDATDKRIYVVDVNKTDMGPPISLPFKDKLRSVSILSQSFMNMLEVKKASHS